MIKFLDLEFRTTKKTFAPRPETGLLVKVCLDVMKNTTGHRQFYILDVGTGTGNIAVSLTKNHTSCKMIALDESAEALKVARANAKRLGVFDRIEFVHSDLFKNVEGRFDIIVSNPPYIPTWEIITLADHVRQEPIRALDGGEDGGAFYRRLINESPRFLKDGGYLAMELGYNQAYKIKNLLQDSGSFRDIRIFKDFANIDRVIRAQWTGY